MAEGFGFQTLQTLQSPQGREQKKSEAGPGVTTRRVVVPKTGFVLHKSVGPERAWTLKASCTAEPF